MWLALGMLPMVYREREGGRARPACAIFAMLWPARALSQVRKKDTLNSYSFLVGLAQCETQSLNILKTSQQLRALPAPLE